MAFPSGVGAVPGFPEETSRAGTGRGATSHAPVFVAGYALTPKTIGEGGDPPAPAAR